MICPAVILAITLFVLYAASAWVMLRSVSNPRLEPIAWVITSAAIIAHSDAIMRMMRSWAVLDRPARGDVAARMDACGAGLLDLPSTNRTACSVPSCSSSAAFGAAVTGAGHTYAEERHRRMGTHGAYLAVHGCGGALLFAAAVTALLLVFLDRRLRTRRIADLPRALPPLDALEKVMFRLMAAGFGLLTLALLTGFMFVTNLFTQNLVHKTVLSLIAWVVFGVLLIGRIRYGWRGRSAVRWTLCGFG